MPKFPMGCGPSPAPSDLSIAFATFAHAEVNTGQPHHSAKCRLGERPRLAGSLLPRSYGHVDGYRRYAARQLATAVSGGDRKIFRPGAPE